MANAANAALAPALARDEREAAPVPLAELGFDARRLMAFLAMVFGMFMSILDIQVVSASLSEIQAGLAASADEVAWVQTSYLVAEVVMIPFSGYLSRLMSTRLLFTLSAAGFTLMSFMCAQATTINQMIIFRAAQGFIGGGMIPSVFVAAYTIFPRNKMTIVAPIIGLVATLAPTIGPTVGGYLTDLFSWHWLFLVNIGPGMIVTIAAWTLIDFDEPDWSLLKAFDFIGLFSMATFLGALEYLLEEGPKKAWFDEEAIVWAAVASAIGGFVFFWRAFTAKEPIVDLYAFSNRNFWMGSLCSFVLGVGLYGLTYIYPIYLARVRGYSALMIGETMFLSGLCMFIAAPLVGRIVTRVDARWLIGLGYFGFAMGTWQATNLTKDWDFYELFLPQILRGFSLMFCMIPINNMALGTLPPARMKNASGLFNLTRNLGGAVGLAMINTTMNNRMDLHLARLHEMVASGRQSAEDTLASLTNLMASRGSDAELAAVAKLAALVRREAQVMALADVFYVLTILFLGMLLLVPFMRRPSAANAAGAGH